MADLYLTPDEKTFMEGVVETMDTYMAFLRNWELTKKFHLRVVPPPEQRERLAYWDGFIARLEPA